MKIFKTASFASAPSLRSIKTNLDAKRRLLARKAVAGQVIAVESEDDPEGFSWWLCTVTTPAFAYDGKEHTTEDGVKLKKGLWSSQ